jgi:hypothetical protein
MSQTRGTASDRMKVHTIRLGEPWERTPLPDGHVRHRRCFGRPRTLDANERLWLVCDRAMTVTVNGTEFGRAERFDITGVLQPRNEVAIDADGLGAVVLEVWGEPSQS